MEISTKKLNIEISTNSIIKILIVVFLLWLLYLIRDVVAILFFSVILVSILEPSVNWLRLRGIPKSLSVLTIYLILISVFAIIVILIIPPISAQINQLSNSFPAYWEKMNIDFSNLADFLQHYGIYQGLKNSLESLKSNLPQATGSIFSRLSDLFQSLVSSVIVLVITFYILAEEGATKRILHSLMPSKYLPYAYQLVNRMESKLGLWLRGQLILGFIIFLFVYVGLLILNVKYALILAILAGLFEFIPYLGPIFSGVVAVFLTLFQSPIKALLVLILFTVIHPLENHIILPKVMQKAVGLNPVVSIVALLIGVKLGGFIGAVLAIPVVTALSVIAQDFFEKKKTEEVQLEG